VGNARVVLGLEPAMRVAAFCVAVVASGTARADDGLATTEHAERISRHLFYVEAFGKAGLYGIGYERTITPRLALGAAASYAVVRDEQIATVVPYLHARLLGEGAHRLFGEIGGELAHSHIPSPVMEWSGMSKTGGGGFAALGYEHAGRHVVVRTEAAVIVGAGGATPWAGFAIGFRP
jgi:hypothetical protein